MNNLQWENTRKILCKGEKTWDILITTVTSDVPTLTCHITVEPGTNTQRVLGEATKRIREQFHIEHVTIQIEDTEHCHNEDHCHT
ncbi:cation transporter dimerization domain-containing protein [Ectobacillus funiculus]|uniref:cation transporter dimerization domain-containing protein n=1 Tax=Ectobacillus funiculus TaxID=137993 RepID=UPI00406B9FB8